MQQETGWDCLAGAEVLGHTHLVESEPAGAWQGWRLHALGCQQEHSQLMGSSYSFLLGICLAVSGILGSSLGHWVHEGCQWTAAKQRVPEVVEAKALVLWGEAVEAGLVQPGGGMASGACSPQDLQRLRLFAEVNSGRIRDSNHKSEWSIFSLI